MQTETTTKTNPTANTPWMSPAFFSCVDPIIPLGFGFVGVFGGFQWVRSMVLSNHVWIFWFSWISSATVCVMFGWRSPGSRFWRERVGNRGEQGGSVSEGENNIITALYYDRMCRAEKRLMIRRLFRQF